MSGILMEVPKTGPDMGEDQKGGSGCLTAFLAVAALWQAYVYSNTLDMMQGNVVASGFTEYDWRQCQYAEDVRSCIADEVNEERWDASPSSVFTRTLTHNVLGVVGDQIAKRMANVAALSTDLDGDGHVDHERDHSKDRGRILPRVPNPFL